MGAMSRTIDLALPWPHIRARLADISHLIGGEDSRLTPQMRRVHQSRCARALAIDLMAEFGVHAREIGKGPVGEPRWPTGAMGSLSHSGSFACAVVAPADSCAGLGIDIEPALPLPGETATLILRDEEHAWVQDIAGREPAADRLVFCAKECVHKAIYPRDQAWLEFTDVCIRFDDSCTRFTPEPATDAARKAFDGLRAEGHVLREHGQFVLLLRLAAAS